jgi:hypothetical protein
MPAFSNQTILLTNKKPAIDAGFHGQIFSRLSANYYNVVFYL